MDRPLLGQMGRLGMVSDVPLMNAWISWLINVDGGQIVYYRSTTCPPNLMSDYKSSCTC